MFNSAFSIGAELIYAALLTVFFNPLMRGQGRNWRKLAIVFSVYLFSSWPATGLPATTKKGNTLMHGIGLSNVRREAEKYMGELELKTAQKEFTATVLLQKRSSL